MIVKICHRAGTEGSFVLPSRGGSLRDTFLLVIPISYFNYWHGARAGSGLAINWTRRVPSVWLPTAITSIWHGPNMWFGKVSMLVLQNLFSEWQKLTTLHHVHVYIITACTWSTILCWREFFLHDYWYNVVIEARRLYILDAHKFLANIFSNLIIRDEDKSLIMMTTTTTEDDEPDVGQWHSFPRCLAGGSLLEQTASNASG